LITIGVPLGLGIDQRPVPALGLLLRHLAQGLLPVKVTGDVEWTLNRLDDGGWLVALLNNRGVIKPQHGVLPTDYRQAQVVTVSVSFHVARSEEWVAHEGVKWSDGGRGAHGQLTIPAGAVRLVAIWPG